MTQPWGAPPPPPAPGERSFYRKKRYVLPALALLGIVALSDPEPEPEPAPGRPDSAQVQPLVERPDVDQRLSEDAVQTIQQVQADVAQEQAAQKAAAAAAAAAEAEAARTAAKRVADQEAARKAAAARAAQEAAAREAEQAEQAETDAQSVSYENCDAVRAAGAAPIRRGDPGYGSHLDRDGDGQGCGQD